MDDIAGFLGSHPPFDVVDAGELARIAAVTETEVSARGKAIFPQGAGPVEFVWVVRSGSVEVVHDGRVLDLLGPGELFGHASMISGLPTGFEARAGEDTVCYRIPSYVIRPLLVRPDVLRFVARSIADRSEPVVRVAAGLSPDGPVSAIMTEPAYTVAAGRLGGDVLLDMLERNVHHIPVLSAAGEVLGVVDDGDLVAAESRKPLLLRRAIALAESQADLAAAAPASGRWSSRCTTRGWRPSMWRRSVRSCWTRSPGG